MAIETSINGNILESTYGIKVTATKGIIDQLAKKPSIVRNWSDFHGLQIDLAKPIYEAREITLYCTLIATSETDFYTKLQNFKTLFTPVGDFANVPKTQRLMFLVGSNAALVYEVFNQKGFEVEKKWRIGRAMYGEFQVTLIEPEPVKKVIKFTGTGLKTINLVSTTPINIYWGENNVTRNCKTITATYTYLTGGDHYVIVTGMIDEITSITYPTGTLVWNKSQ